MKYMYVSEAESTLWDTLILYLGNLLDFQSCCWEGRVQSTHTWELVSFHTYCAILSFTLLICKVRVKPCSYEANCYHKPHPEATKTFQVGVYHFYFTWNIPNSTLCYTPSCYRNYLKFE